MQTQKFEREISELYLELAHKKRGLEEALTKFNTIQNMSEGSTDIEVLQIEWLAEEGKAMVRSHLRDDMIEVEGKNAEMSHTDRLRSTHIFNREAIEYILNLDTSPPFDSVYHHPLSAGPEPAEDRWIREDIPF